jgi:hypothetical protein
MVERRSSRNKLGLQYAGSSLLMVIPFVKKFLDLQNKIRYVHKSTPSNPLWTRSILFTASKLVSKIHFHDRLTNPHSLRKRLSCDLFPYGFTTICYIDLNRGKLSPLSPRHGVYSRCGRWRWPRGMESSCGQGLCHGRQVGLLQFECRARAYESYRLPRTLSGADCHCYTVTVTGKLIKIWPSEIITI